MVLISALSPNFLAIAAIPGKFLSGMFLGQHKHQGDLFFFGSGVNYFFSPVYAASCFCICSIKTKKRIHNKKKKIIIYF